MLEWHIPLSLCIPIIAADVHMNTISLQSSVVHLSKTKDQKTVFKVFKI